jgi:hypothetical protein
MQCACAVDDLYLHNIIVVSPLCYPSCWNNFPLEEFYVSCLQHKRDKVGCLLGSISIPGILLWNVSVMQARFCIDSSDCLNNCTR